MVKMSVLNDALKNIANAEKAGKRQVLLRPISKVLVKFLRCMQKHGYINEFEIIDDNRGEGMAGAHSEQKQRQERAALTWQTPFPTPVKAVGIEKGPFKGTTLIRSSAAGIESREAALLLRAHNLQGGLS